MSATLRPSRSSLKYQLPSTVSPYRQAPTSLSSLRMHELFVHAFKGVAQHDFFGAAIVRPMEVARREQIDARDFELGGGQRALCSGQCRTRPNGWPAPCLVQTAGPPNHRQCHGGRRIRPRHRCAGRSRFAACRSPQCRGSQCRRIFSASAVLGRMPTAITTRSAGTWVPSLNNTLATRPSVLSSLQFLGLSAHAGTACRVPAASVATSILPATLSSWRSISHSPTCTTVTLHAALHEAVGGFEAEQTAANHHGMLVLAAASIMACVSAMSR